MGVDYSCVCGRGVAFDEVFIEKNKKSKFIKKYLKGLVESEDDLWELWECCGEYKSMRGEKSGSYYSGETSMWLMSTEIDDNSVKEFVNDCKDAGLKIDYDDVEYIEEVLIS